MLNKISKSLEVLLREKHSLSTRARKVARTERRLIDNLSRALSGVGYRLVPVAGSRSGGAAQNGTTSIKRLRCPKCERRFAHPLPMARHLSATHGIKKGAAKAPSQKPAAKAKKKGPVRKSA